jgi:hypothetical protein
MKNIKKILKDPRTYYVIALLVIVLYPPINDTWPRGKRSEFIGWDFISLLGGDYKINIPYIAIEFFIVSIIYFIYRKKD